MNNTQYVYKIWYEKITEETVEIVAETIHEAEAQLKGRHGRILHTTELRRHEEGNESSNQPGT